MILDISPTRMELLKLKKKLVIATKGHKLLKDKLDEFIRHLMRLIDEVAELRETVDKKFFQAKKYMVFANHSTFPEAAKSSLAASENKLNVKVEYRQLLNLKVPEFHIIEEEKKKRSYGFAQTSIALDLAIDLFNEISADMIRLAGKEKTIQMIADEIEKTRRRVNALEYILIPNVEDTIKYITMKLEEQERSSLTQLMRIKDTVRV